jgi:hypothetical protein
VSVSIAAIPTLPTLALTDDEQSLVERLNNQRSVIEPTLRQLDSYYNGHQLIRDLGISIPPQMRGMQVGVAWPRITVDALEERLDVQGFRYASSADGDDELWDIWQANNLDEESQLAHLDALVYGRAFACVGVNDDDSPLITVESPRHMSVLWDPRWRAITAALRVYGGDEYGQHVQATLYLPEQTVYLAQEGTGWVVSDRDRHNLGQVPVARLANRQRVSDRDGRSEITPEIMKITDAACRTLIAMEVAREFFAAPQRYVLGASEEDFKGPDGSNKSPWETYLGRYLALTRDPDSDQLPQVGQFTANDPSAYTKILDALTEQMATASDLPPYRLGRTTANPASADAIRSAENGLVKKAQRRQVAFSGGWENVMRLALRMTNNGDLPDEARFIETLWADAATPTPAATTDAVTKQIAAGAIPATSDVTRERLGYSVIERQRLAIDDKAAGGTEFLAQLAHSVLAKDARTDLTAARDIGGTGNPAAQ